MSRHWRMVPTTEGTMCVYVGVHAIDWQPEWGPPSVAFIDDVEDETATLRTELEACKLEQDAFARECILAYSEQPARDKSATAAIAEVRRKIQEADNER